MPGHANAPTAPKLPALSPVIAPAQSSITMGQTASINGRIHHQNIVSSHAMVTAESRPGHALRHTGHCYAFRPMLRIQAIATHSDRNYASVIVLRMSATARHTGRPQCHTSVLMGSGYGH